MGVKMGQKACPYCQGKKIRRYGYKKVEVKTLRGKQVQKRQRYYCNECQKSFSHNTWNKRKRHSENFIKKTVQLYIESKASSREVAKLMQIDQSTIVRWVNQYGQVCLNTAQTNDKLKPKWRGIIGIDGKVIHVGGSKKACLLATDLATVDIAHFSLAESEDESGCRAFLLGLEKELSSLKGIVSDLGRGKVWLKLVAEIFPDIPHQACIVHFERYIDQILPKSEKCSHYHQNQLLRTLIKQLLYATSFNDAEEIFTRLMRLNHYFKADYQRSVLKSLKNHFDLLTAHFHNPGLERTNNITENIIKQLDRKIFLLSDFSSSQSAYSFLNLWVLSYRFKPLSSSSFTFRNGFSPLSLAGVKTDHINWLDFGLFCNT